jgi:succinate-semialdehyde dehydrogenase/glutarate-semialdehyde dehydrogenase
MMIEDLFRKAGFPDGIYTNIFISGSQSEHIIAHPAIAGVNITASETAGSLIGSLAGKYLKPSVLELGGNDPFVLLDHKDTKKIATEAVAYRISMG